MIFKFKELLDAGVHFGHLMKMNPNMAPYVAVKENRFIISLYKQQQNLMTRLLLSKKLFYLEEKFYL